MPYLEKRDFAVTPEPLASRPSAGGDLFVVQQHAATRLHYDFRLEMGGALRSWAVTRGPSLDPGERRLAVSTEDHPVSYGEFEGSIPSGQYGAGTVIVWDTGTWAPMGDIEAGLAKGDLKFRLDGRKMKGGWALVRIKNEEKNWLLIKETDSYAEKGSGDAIVHDHPASVLSGLTITEMAERFHAAPVKPRKLPKPRPASLPNAEKAPLGDVPGPELATLADTPPAGDGWIHEIKYDGYRTLARIEGGEVRLFTRNGHDWTDRYGSVAAALADLGCKTAVLDGEVCVQTPSGATSFAALQDALAEGATEKMVYFAFDLLHLDGYDLRRTPLAKRRRALEALLAPHAGENSPVHFSEHFAGEGAAVFEQAGRLGLEGIVSKRAGSAYVSGRSRDWIKVKSAHAGEFTVVGYTESKAAGGLAALLLAEPGGQGLTYVGKVGTGFTAAIAGDLAARLKALVRKEPVFTLYIDETPSGTVWVEPRLLVEVQYANRTPKGHLRAPTYRGLRSDLAVAAPAEGSRPARQVTDTDLAGIWITNPGRPMFGEDGPTKLDIALYYARVGDWILPEIAERPLTLIRCPTGKAEDCFYQRHARPGMPNDVKRIPLSDEGKTERADFLYVSDARGLLSLAQFGVVEFHPWGCKADKPERPDRMVLDLDPDEGLEWREVIGAAAELREALADLGIGCFVRTTGGKGLHLVVPVERRISWKAMKIFSQALVVHLAKQFPGRYTVNPAKSARRGRIYLDYLRNTRGATAVGSYSLRARPGVPAAVPLAWNELAGLEDPAELNWRTVPERLDPLAADPWSGIEQNAVRITEALKAKIARPRPTT